MSDINDIRAEASERQISRLAHFTPLRNLVHIATDDEGLRSTLALEADERAAFNQQDLERLDGYPDHISCAIEFPNAYYFRKKRRDARGVSRIFPRWVCLLIEPHHLWQETTLLFHITRPGGVASTSPPGSSTSGPCSLPRSRRRRQPGKGSASRGRALRMPRPRCWAHRRIPLADIKAIGVEDSGQAADTFEVLKQLNAPVESIPFIVCPDFYKPTGPRSALPLAGCPSRCPGILPRMTKARRPVVETQEAILGRPQIAARARAAMLFAACGDALGWPIEPRGRRVGGTAGIKPRLEFLDWRRREGGGYAPFERRVPPGTYSDDTQLMLCVARSLTHGDGWWEHLTKVELPLWPLYDLGGGGAVRSAARSSARLPPLGGRERKKPASLSRGWGKRGRDAVPASRDLRSRLPLLLTRCRADSGRRHHDPWPPEGPCGRARRWLRDVAALRWRGKVGYGDLVDACLDERSTWSRLPESEIIMRWVDAGGRSRSTAVGRDWEQAGEEMVGLLSVCADAMQRGSLARDRDVLEELGAFGKENGSGTRSAAVAVYLASRYVAKPAAGLLAAAFARHADTDTIACLTGAMLGVSPATSRLTDLPRGC